MRLWKVHSNSGNGAGSQSNGQRAVNQRLITSLVFATHVVDDIATMHGRDRDQQGSWEMLYGDHFTMPRDCMASSECVSGLMGSVKVWLQQHEEAQIMMASILVVFGLWWLARTILSVLINLVCPLLVVVLAVILVPQLRAPLLGQNYPALANVLRAILLKLAENMKTE